MQEGGPGSRVCASWEHANESMFDWPLCIFPALCQENVFLKQI